jgi:hypothetical protein
MINFAEIAYTAFNNVLGTDGVVIDGVVYSIDSNGNNIETDTLEQTIKDEMDRVRNEIQYKHERAGLYPDIHEQLDQLWHGMDADETKRIEPFYTTIKEIKDTFPKDGSNNTVLEILEE